MELIKRYVYAVIHRLPEPMRADVEKELHGLILDMLEERAPGGEPSPEQVEEVLLELGDPERLADQYRGTRRYLIGPDLFPAYFSVLKIVLSSIAIAMAVLFAVEALLEPPQALHHMAGGLASLLTALMQGFVWVTVIFGYAEYAGIQEKLKPKSARAWKPSDLQQIPDPKLRIRKSDPVTGMIFTVLLFVLCTFSFDLFGLWIQRDGTMTVVRFFDETVFRPFLPFIWLWLALNVMKDCVKLITGKWTLKLAALELVLVIYQLVLAGFMFADTSIWNPIFVEQAADAGLVQAGSDAFDSLQTAWDAVTGGMLVLIAFCLVIHLGVVAAKAYRMSQSRS
ncbi:hypothetical protein [Gorillibacterium sp. sgz5001074]|uniref:hypothetical protein n=1 Tax=Gorillibacterium sp. sgz5001074 TaxID=3446695 RepID=UPI003F67772C